MRFPHALCSHPCLQSFKNNMRRGAYSTVYHIRELFDQQARFERFEVFKLLFCSKMAEGTSPVMHALKMNGYKEVGSVGFWDGP